MVCARRRRRSSVSRARTPRCPGSGPSGSRTRGRRRCSGDPWVEIFSPRHGGFPVLRTKYGSERPRPGGPIQMRNKGLGALVLSVVGIALALPSAALAAKPGATSGAAANVTFQSVRVNGSVDPNREATNYYFQYGTTAVYGTATPMAPAGAGANAVRVSMDIGGLAPATRYHYRIVAVNASGTTAGRHRTFTTRRQAARRLARGDAEPARGREAHGAGGHPRRHRQRGPAGSSCRAALWPYTQGFAERRQRAGHQRPGRLLVPGAVGALQHPVPGPDARARGRSSARSSRSA